VGKSSKTQLSARHCPTPNPSPEGEGLQEKNARARSATYPPGIIRETLATDATSSPSPLGEGLGWGSPTEPAALRGTSPPQTPPLKGRGLKLSPIPPATIIPIAMLPIPAPIPIPAPTVIIANPRRTAMRINRGSVRTADPARPRMETTPASTGRLCRADRGQRHACRNRGCQKFLHVYLALKASPCPLRDSEKNVVAGTPFPNSQNGPFPAATPAAASPPKSRPSPARGVRPRRLRVQTSARSPA